MASHPDDDSYYDRGAGAWLTNVALQGLLVLPKALPFRWRVPLVGWVTANVIGPLAGYNRRGRENLSFIYPDMPEGEARRLARHATDNAGRMMIECYSTEDLMKEAERTEVTGVGMGVLDEAAAEGRPLIALTGHFGNYDVARAVAKLHGHELAVLYRPFTNFYFDRHYSEMLQQISRPTFPIGRRGLGAMLKHLRGGGMMAILADQHQHHGAPLTFMGKKARTALSAAEMALKYDAVLLPAFCIRKPDGSGFELHLDEPIAHTTPEQMMQEFNDLLEAQVRAHPEQWLWAHRRWRKIKKKTAT